MWFQMWKSGELPKPKLGLNCVGGASGLELCKVGLAMCPLSSWYVYALQVLADKGVHVTYGGMSRKPVTAATSHMIFKVWQEWKSPIEMCYHVKTVIFILCEFHQPGPWATWFLDGPVEWEAGQKWSKVCKWKSAQVASGSNTCQLLDRMSMMAALGQLAKDGSLLAPTHKHIGISQFTPIFCSFTIFNFHISTECSFSLQSSCRRFLRLQRGFGEKSSGIPAGKVHLQGWTNLESSESESNYPGGPVIKWVTVFGRVKGM